MPTAVIPSAAKGGEHPDGPRGLLAVASAQTERFGTVYFGRRAETRAVGVWGGGLPLVHVPELVHKAGVPELLSKTTSMDGFGGGPVTFEVEGHTGWFHQPHTGFSNPWFRKHRAFHVELPTRRYTYYLRWSYRVVEREHEGQVLRTVPDGYRIAPEADATDAAVALLAAWAVSRHHLSFWPGVIDLFTG